MMASLDRHASSVSPQALYAGAPALPAPAKCGAPSDDGRSEARRARYELRRAAGRIMSSERVADCGRKALGGQVTLHIADGHAHFGGVETCGSIWMCPVCAAKITEVRRAEIDAVLQAHSAAGGVAFMATLTIPHHAFQAVADLRNAISKAWRSVKSGKGWLTKRRDCRWLGDVRALEVTHGRNGWHPHLHVLILFEPDTPPEAFWELGDWVFQRWARAIERQGFGECSAAAFSWDKVNAATGAADYVSKWGAAHELAKAHTKRGRDGGRTPWQILADASEPQKSADRRLFREYARAFKGTKHLTWSRGLRDRYDSVDERPDDEVAVEPTAAETHCASLDGQLFRLVAARNLVANILDAVERDGLAGVVAVLNKHGIPCRLSMAPGMQPGRMVPVLSPGSTGDPPCPIPRQFAGYRLGRHQQPATSKGNSHAAANH